MPSSLLAAMARVIEAGANVVDVQDANLRPVRRTADLVGVSLLGAPYVPLVREDFLRPDAPRLIVGGQVINGFVEKDSQGRTVDRRQFDILFGKNSLNGNDDHELAAILGINTRDLPPISHVSLIPAYERIRDEDMKRYLSNEFSFFLSQGCNFSCTFCAAVRTIRDPLTGNLTKVKEEYRGTHVVEKDLRYLVERAQKLGLSHIDFYLSNLDVFQTPSKLMEFAETVGAVKKDHPGFAINMRGLTTVDSFVRAHKKTSDSIRAMKSAGFHTVGFGVDGGTPAVWRSIRKNHNTEDKCLEAIRISREEYDFTPELLMVFGHPKENEESLQAAVDFTKDMVVRYGAVPRPHVAKDIIPANENWREPGNQERVEFLLSHPEYFQALDFTALPSSISHPDPRLRELVTKYYLEICTIPGNTTNPVYPIAPEMSEAEKERNRILNIGRWDR